MISHYQYFVKSFFTLSTRFSKRFYRIPLIYFLPIFHINRVHYSENSSTYCFSFKSFFKDFIFSLALLPLRSFYILFNSIYFSFSYRTPTFLENKQNRLFLSHFVPSAVTDLKHVFQGIPSCELDYHLVTSSLYDKDYFYRQYFVPNNNRTIYCRSFMPIHLELYYIFYAILLIPLLLFKVFSSRTFIQKLFFLNAINQLISLQSLIPLRLDFNLRWLSSAFNKQISDVFISYEGYAWEHAAMNYFLPTRASVSLYCHAPITPNNLSCFRNNLLSFNCTKLFVANNQTASLFLKSFCSNHKYPSIHTFAHPSSLNPSIDTSMVAHSSIPCSSHFKTILLLPENLLSEVFLFLRFISFADKSYTFLLRLHPRTSSKDRNTIKRFIAKFLPYHTIRISSSTLNHDANLAFITLFRASSAIISSIISSNTIPVFLNDPEKPCPNPLYFMDSSLFLSCNSFSQMTSISFVRPSSAFYYRLLS